MVHHANRIRPNPSGIKVGGHQASSASVVSILTSLFFDFMQRGDRIAVKPHASPALHAIHYLLGNLDRQYLTKLRDYHGLQAYPSRTKDPDPIDFSTGSVGLGAVAPNFAALAERFVEGRFGVGKRQRRRFLAIVGDAELDEGSIWEAVAEPALARLDNVIWVIDVNRQSLDRVIPGIRVLQWEAMFKANGWKVLEAKYGARLQAAFQEPGGHELRRRIDDLPNEEYQVLLRSSAATVRKSLHLDRLAPRRDAVVKALISDLGGHDLRLLHDVLHQADAADGPSVIFAYTVKGWGLPIAGDPLNHSALLSEREVDELRSELGIPVADQWDPFPVDSPAGRICAERGRVLAIQNPQTSRMSQPSSLSHVPSDLGTRPASKVSTQHAFGQILTSLSRISPETARRVVTVSPDVATSTNLGGWINKVGVWDQKNEHDLFSAVGPRLIQWERSPQGQHIELGISETNLLMMLGQLGLADSFAGKRLIPIGTIYDPFIARALDAFIYGVYSGSRFILVGTPSGISLAPEGGAHQSVITPSIGLALPAVTYWEPCFALELEWILLHAIRSLWSDHGGTTYLRLTTAPVDQALLPIEDRESLRRQVLSGAYRLADRRTEPGSEAGHNQVDIWASGIAVPIALRASAELREDGVYASVINCTSPDIVYRRWQADVRAARSPDPAPIQPPVVTVIDGHPSALAWVGSMLGSPAWPLGVTGFGESGTPDELYKAADIDEEAISLACFAALGVT